MADVEKEQKQQPCSEKTIRRSLPEVAEDDGLEAALRCQAAAVLLQNPCEETLWNCIVAFRGCAFKTMSGLPFTYQLKKGRRDTYTKELWIDRRESSKSLAWSSVLLAFRNIGTIGRVVDRPKALGDIRGISYIYGIFCLFGLIEMPEKKKKDEKIR